MTPEMIYWITRADAIQALCLSISIVGGILLMIGSGLLITCIAEKEISPKVLWSLLLWVLWFPFLLSSVLVPSTKDLALIYMVPKIANSEIVKDLPNDIQYIKDLAMKRIEGMLVDKGKEIIWTERG